MNRKNPQILLEARYHALLQSHGMPAPTPKPPKFWRISGKVRCSSCRHTFHTEVVTVRPDRAPPRLECENCHRDCATFIDYEGPLPDEDPYEPPGSNPTEGCDDASGAP